MISPGDSIRQDAGDDAGDLGDRTAGFSGTAELDKPKSEEVKERASRATQEAKDALGRATSDLAEQARAAGGELRGAASRVADEAKGRLGEVKSRIGDQAGARKDMVAGSVSSLGAAVREAADRLEGDQSPIAAPVATYVRTAADGLDRVADHLRNADLRDLYDEAERFTRRHPEVVLGGLFLVGIGIARFLKSSAEDRRREVAADRLRSGGLASNYGSYGREMRPVGQFGVGGYGDLDAPAGYPSDFSDVGPAAVSVGPDDFARADEQLTDFDAGGYGNTSGYGDAGAIGGSSLGATGSSDLAADDGLTTDVDLPSEQRAPR